MPSRLAKLFSSSEKEKEALAEAERNNAVESSSPPPGYSEEYDRENVLEPPDITAGFSQLSISPSSANKLPESAECIAHLKVLECFYRLKQTVGSYDKLFGINNDFVTGHQIPATEKTAQLLANLAEKRWAVYLQRAVDRFETWWAAVTPASRMITRARLEDGSKVGSLVRPDSAEAPALTIDKSNVPPVDVLMVWHAYMLNPRAYFEDCIRYGRLSLWHTPMPWQAASDSINPETFAFEAGPAAEAHFTSITGLPWNNLSDKNSKRVHCPRCQTRIWAPWTTCSELAPPKNMTDEKLVESAIDSMLQHGKGYCDKDFEAQCTSCALVLNHDRLRVGKFVKDVNDLVTYDVPLGGTILGTDEGIPGMAFGKKDYSSPLIQKTPNVLMKEGLGSKIVSMNERGDASSVNDIREAIEAAMLEKKYMNAVRTKIHGRRMLHVMDRHERVAVRKMMSRYWDNSSPFALDLVGAVIRQGSFIEKMHNIDWLHSPALPNTMSRLVRKYTVFLHIISNSNGRMAVPTLDVDLAWHTHQLSPARYCEYTILNSRQFIDHDDKVAEVKLNDSFAWTSKQFTKLTGQPYSECTCWYCEAIRESHTSPASRLFNTSNAKAATKLLHKPDQDPRKSVHISAHNAVRPMDNDPTYRALSNAKAAELERHYQKACDRAQKKGRPVPKRDDYYYSDAYGYPVYIPAYSPYVGFVPYAPMYYPVTPGCMAVGAGAVGNCCTGTCGGGVAAGGCAGVGSGGCGAGSAGGCGGGGGGCGGGGGGCGGGGGGCGG